MPKQSQASRHIIANNGIENTEMFSCKCGTKSVLKPSLGSVLHDERLVK